MVLEQAGHRTGALKQKNKSHKTGRHRSKGQIDNALKGRASIKVVSKKHKLLMRKDQRRNQANQIRKNKREEMFAKKRTLGGSDASPFLITVLPVNLQIDVKSALETLKKCDPDAFVYTPKGSMHMSIPRFKQRFSFIIPPIGRGEELNVLDYLKVSDTTIVLMSAAFGEDDIIDKWGHKMLNMAIAQGLPTPIVSLMDLESINPKKRTQVKTDITKIIQRYLPAEKPMNLDTNSDAISLIRRIGGQKKNILHNKANRFHLFGQKTVYIPDAVGPMGTLEIAGYVRGKSLDVNQLIHIPGLGDFQMSELVAATDPYCDSAGESLHKIVCAAADPQLQTKLIREHIPDEMEAEQTWPTEDEIAQSKEENKTKKFIKKIPKGMSDYQACWIPDIEERDEEDDDDDDEDSESDDQDFMSCDSSQESEYEKSEKDDEECDTVSVTVSEAPVNDEKYDQEMDLEEEKHSLQKLKEARTDQMWPDEMDTPTDVVARTRFQKYRGLESFRTSPWDIKENLPSDYARIFQFQNFDRTKRRVLKEIDNGIRLGSFLKLYVPNVPQTLWNNYIKTNPDCHLVVYGLLPNEHKMSVMNVMLKRTPDSTIPLKSKEKLIIQCGYRRFIVNPIYSQHTNGNKHKYERYFRPNSTVVATFFAPIQFPPSPILCFMENPDTTLSLVATGGLLSCNPDRIVLKRIVLSGHPFKINRKVATVRHMFFNKEDVDFFKPIRLRTKCGRLGHIKESLGTHGHMKCYFDGQLKSFDTVFLYLFKRVFPKWNYEDCIVTSPKTEEKDSVMDE